MPIPSKTNKRSCLFSHHLLFVVLLPQSILPFLARSSTRSRQRKDEVDKSGSLHSDCRPLGPIVCCSRAPKGTTNNNNNNSNSSSITSPFNGRRPVTSQGKCRDKIWWSGTTRSLVSSNKNRPASHDNTCNTTTTSGGPDPIQLRRSPPHHRPAPSRPCQPRHKPSSSSSSRRSSSSTGHTRRTGCPYTRSSH